MPHRAQKPFLTAFRGRGWAVACVATLCVATLWDGAGELLAQSPGPSTDQLLQTLAQQEARIAELENRLRRETTPVIEPLPPVGSLPIAPRGLPSFAAAGQEPLGPAQEPGAPPSPNLPTPVDPSAPASATESASEDDSIEARLAKLEESVLGFERLQEQEASFLESVSSESTRTVNGRLHLDYWNFPGTSSAVNLIEQGDPADDPLDRFENRRARIGIIGRVPPDNVSYRLEFEFSGLERAQLRDGWLGWDQVLFFDTVRIGNQKRPYSLDQLNSSNFTTFMERSLVAEAFNRNNRRLGAASFGDSSGRRLNWNYGIFNLVPIQADNRILTDRYQWELAGRIAWTWWFDEVANGRGYGHLGLSGSLAFPDGNAPNDGQQDNQARFRSRPEGRSQHHWYDTGRIAQAQRYELLGLESVFNAGSLQLGGEYMGLWLQRDELAGPEVQLHGGYVYASWFITGEHIPWNRSLGIQGRVIPFENFFLLGGRWRDVERGLGAWQLAARYSNVDLNDSGVNGGRGDSATAALNWYWNSHSRLQFNYIWGRIHERSASLPAGGVDNVSGSYQIAGIRFMIDF